MDLVDSPFGSYLGTGLYLRTIPDLGKVARCRTHRKRRIDKKWLKRYGFERVPTTEVYIMGDTILYVHNGPQELQRSTQ